MPTITFLESFAAVLLQRAIFFYTKDRLDFSDLANLCLALVAGVTYVAGALLSHAISARAGERRTLWAVIAGQLLVSGIVAGFVHVVADVAATSVLLFVAIGVLGALMGVKWPLIESYTSAGLAPAASARAIGRFNFAWASSIPVSLAVAGPLIATSRWALFAVAGTINAVSLVLIVPLGRRPVHLPPDHPERPDTRQVRHLARLATAARWIMLASYSGLWILGALMPGVFRELHFRARSATALFGLTDLARLLAFVVLGAWTAWHGRRAGLLRAMIFLPAGFCLMLSAPNLAVVLLGELLFGLGAGEAYYAALYYAMVVKNASVDAGGVHEGLIGLGFVIGPAAGLIGLALAPVLRGQQRGVLAVAAVVFLVCFVQAARSLLPRRPGPSDRPPQRDWPEPL